MNDDYHKAKKYKVKVKNSVKGSKTDFKWAIKIVMITFCLAAVFNVTSSLIMNEVNIFIAFLILIFIIFIGIFFDIIGIAVTAADETPFHSMAAHKVRGSTEAIKLIRNRDKVSNFCNDVIGDICGIVSGSVAAAVANFVIQSSSAVNSILGSLFVTSVVAALTVGGKALGKAVAVSKSNNIVYFAALFIDVFRRQKNRDK